MTGWRLKILANEGGASLAEYACVCCCVGVAGIGATTLFSEAIGEEGSMGYATCEVRALLDEEVDCLKPPSSTILPTQDDVTPPPKVESDGFAVFRDPRNRLVVLPVPTGMTKDEFIQEMETQQGLKWDPQSAAAALAINTREAIADSASNVDRLRHYFGEFIRRINASDGDTSHLYKGWQHSPPMAKFDLSAIEEVVDLLSNDPELGNFAYARALAQTAQETNLALLDALTRSPVKAVVTRSTDDDLEQAQHFFAHPAIGSVVYARRPGGGITVTAYSPKPVDSTVEEPIRSMPLEFELEDADWSQLVRKETPDAILNHLAHQRDELARQLARIDELFDREYKPKMPTDPTTPAPPRAVAVTKSGFLGATEINDFLREHNYVVAEGVELPRCERLGGTARTERFSACSPRSAVFPSKHSSRRSLPRFHA